MLKPPAPLCQVVAFVGADEDHAIVSRFALLHFAAPVSLPGTTSMMSPTSQFSALQMRSITFVATHSPFDIFVKVVDAYYIISICVSMTIHSLW